PAPPIAGLLLFLLTAGCVGIEDAPPHEPLQPDATPPAPRSMSKVPASPAPTKPLQRKTPEAPITVKPEVEPTLDLASLEKRLRESKAIGILTKISLKNQVGDLVDQFRAFHQRRVGTAL